MARKKKQVPDIVIPDTVSFVEMHRALYCFGGVNWDDIKLDPPRQKYWSDLLESILSSAEALGHVWTDWRKKR